MFCVVTGDPFVEIVLQFFERSVDLLSKCNLIELFENRSVESFADAVGLRALCFRLSVINVLDGEVQLIVVLIRLSAILGAAVGEHAKQRNTVRFEEGNHSIVQQVGCLNRLLLQVELGEVIRPPLMSPPGMENSGWHHKQEGNHATRKEVRSRGDHSEASRS